MQVAVAGYGYWGKNLARNFSKLGALRAICDIDQRQLRDAEASYPGVRLTNDYSYVLKSKEIAGVVIASSTSQHYLLAKQALLADKDIFVEKPFTLKVEDAEELMSLATDRGKILMVGHLMLYHPAIQWLKKHTRSGELGEIHYLYSVRVNLGQVRRDEDVIWRLAPHDLSILIYLLDEIPSVISAQSFSYIQPDIADVAFVLLRFGTTVAHIQVSWLDPHKVRQLTVVGSKKMIIFDDTAPIHKLRVYDKGVERVDLSIRSEGTHYPRLDTTSPLAAECTEFISCMQSRKQPLSGAGLGLEVVKTLETITKATRKTAYRRILK